MRVFIHKGPDGEFPSVNFFVAYQGFKELGCEIIPYLNVADIDPTREDVVVDYVDQTRHIFQRLDREFPEISYPEELTPYLGRALWTTTVDAISNNPVLWPVFIKPKGLKVFTGRVIRSLHDFRATRQVEEDTPIWASTPVEFVAEWRCFIRYGNVIDMRRYSGIWYANPDTRLISRAAKDYTSAPAGCSLDFGLTREGQTLLVEVNEGYSLGAYGLFPLNYAKLLTARWSQIMGVEDPYRDLQVFA